MDILFRPQKQLSEIPLPVELNHGESINKVIDHVEEKDYIAHLRKEEYHRDVLLFGIDYSPDTKAHICRIEKIRI